MKKVVTVLGEINPSDMGKTTAHDHVFIDMSNQFRAPDEVSRAAIVEDELTLQNAGLIRKNPWAIRGNLIVNEMEVALKEVEEFKRRGGGTIVDVSNIGLGRDPKALEYVARATGVNIIAGSGYYYEATHPSDMADKSEEQICDEIVRDVTEGIAETGVRSGVIGEIGVSELMQKSEIKSIAGAAKAQKKTGAPVEIHIFPWLVPGTDKLFGNEALDVAEKNGADLSKVCVNHVDVARKIDTDYIVSLLKRGVFVSFDNFGHDFPIPRDCRKFVPGTFSTDWERCESILELLNKGFGKRILVANDICHKHLLMRYGGCGYAHVLETVRDMMLDLGAGMSDVDDLLINNPAEFFAF